MTDTGLKRSTKEWPAETGLAYFQIILGSSNSASVVFYAQQREKQTQNLISSM